VQPPASLQALADPIYEAFYGLKEQPFAISTDPKFLFMSAPHRRAFEELVAGLKRRESMLLLSGETGSGKTTLCRAVLGALGDRTFSALILNPYMAGAELFRVILRDFGFVSRDELKRGEFANADVPMLLETLQGFLKSLLPLDSYAVVVIDEAQNLPATVLDQIRLLTAFEHEGRRMVQVVLVGQPMLLSTLKTEPMYALNERLTRRVTLTPLTPTEVDSYIRHRLEIAGGTERITFPPESTRLVADLSRGLPRRINVLCDRALQEGRIEGSNSITPDLVKKAARSIAGALTESHEDDVPPPAAVAIKTEDAAHSAPLTLGGLAEPSVGGRGRRLVVAAAGLAVIVLAAGGFYAQSVIGSDPGIPAAQPPTIDLRPAKPLPIPTDAQLQAWIDAQKTPPPGGGG
jgi:general secretion pathway protein A